MIEHYGRILPGRNFNWHFLITTPQCVQESALWKEKPRFLMGHECKVSCKHPLSYILMNIVTPLLSHQAQVVQMCLIKLSNKFPWKMFKCSLTHKKSPKTKLK